MTKTQTAPEIVEKINSLPELPEVTAKDMLHAHYEPTPPERAAILARADLFESMGMSRKVNVRVVDFQDNHIGNLEFHL